MSFTFIKLRADVASFVICFVVGLNSYSCPVIFFPTTTMLFSCCAEYDVHHGNCMSASAALLWSCVPISVVIFSTFGQVALHFVSRNSLRTSSVVTTQPIIRTDLVHKA